MKNSRHVLLAAAGIASVVAAAIGLSPGVLGASTPGYTVANVGAYGGEPSIVSDNSGRLYISTPSGGTITRAAWGKTIRRIARAYVMPSDLAASSCPGSIAAGKNWTRMS